MWLILLFFICQIYFQVQLLNIEQRVATISIDNQKDSKSYDFDDYPLLHNFMEYDKRDYTRYVEKSKFFHHLQDERELSQSTFNNTYIKPQRCTTVTGITLFSYIP